MVSPNAGVPDRGHDLRKRPINSAQGRWLLIYCSGPAAGQQDRMWLGHDATQPQRPEARTSAPPNHRVD
jgi:hypothetical protein